MAKKTQAPQTQEKRPVGRPSDYRPDYCAMLIEHMRQGLSFESFAGVVEATKQTIYSWLDHFPEFLDAKQKGHELSRLFWENLAVKGIWNQQGEGATNLNTRLWEINMQNRFRDEWKPKDAATVNVGVQVNNNAAQVESKISEAKQMLESAMSERKPLKTKKGVADRT